MNTSSSFSKRVALVALCLSLLVVVLGAMTAAAAPAPVNVTGTIGVNADPDATLGAANLRYTGDPAPANYSHSYQWTWPRIVCTPDTVPTTIAGTVDVTNMAVGDVAFIGLIDKGLLELTVSGNQSGAYLYLYKNAANNIIVAPTDGNLNAEIVQVSTNVEIPSDNILDVNVTIDGSADPNTCGGLATSPNDVGCVSVSVENSPVVSDSYGNVKSRNNANLYAHTEFAQGAYLGWDDVGRANAVYDLEVNGCEAVWPVAELTPSDDLICNTAEVTIDFSDMPPFYGYQFKVLYDEAKVDAVGAFNNNWFDTTNWAQIPGGWGAVCGSGACKFGVSKVDPATPVSGAGTVGKVTFTAQTAGVFDVEIDNLIVTDIDGFQIPVQLPPSAIEMTTCGHASVSGKVSLQGRLTPIDAGAVKAIDMGGNFPDVTVPFDALGNFSMPSLPVMPGGSSYKLQATHILYVGNEKQVALNPGDTLTNQNTRLWGGDANNSGLNPPYDTGVDISDLSCVAGAFDGPPIECIPNVQSSTDINKDNVTNIQDLAITGGNFGKHPFQTW